MLGELLEKFQLFFIELGYIHFDLLQDIDQGIDAGFGFKEFVDDHYLLILQNAITGLESSFLIANHIMVLLENGFQQLQSGLVVFETHAAKVGREGLQKPVFYAQEKLC